MKVLIVRVGALGDVLHALPAVAALRAERPEWTIDWVVDERWAALLGGGGSGPIVNTTFKVPIREWKRAPLSRATLLSLFKFRNLRNSHDLVVDMQGTMRSAAIGRLAGGRQLVGYRDPREVVGWLYGQKFERRGRHVVEQGAALLSDACRLPLRPAEVELPLVEWAEQWAEGLVGSRRICVLAAGGGWGAKHWPAAKYGALAQAMRATGYEILVNAPRKDDAVANAVVAASGGAAKVVVCNVAGLVALLRRAALVIGGDSGPTHLAAALGIPLVGLYGPTDPARNGPWGPGPKRVLRDPASVTSYRHVAEPDAGLARITVEQAVEAMREIAAGTGA